MSDLTISEIEHDVVIPCGPTERLPEAAETVRALGLRMLHYGWPGMTRTQEGELLVAASERILHVDPYGREALARSADNGRTWSAPETLYDSATDDRDIALNVLPDGSVVATWFSSMEWAQPGRLATRPEWEPLRKRLGPDTLRALSRGWLRRSPDHGRTWEERVYPTPVGQHAGPTPLSNGDMLYCGPYHLEDGSEMVAALSSDRGRTWRIAGRIPSRRVEDPETGARLSWFNENHSIEIAPGRIITALRTRGEPRNVYLTRSNDGARTWSDPEDLGVYGFPPYLLRLASGVIVCVFSDRREPRSIRAIVSRDGGDAWDVDNVLTLRELSLGSGVDMGYPVAVETEPDEVFCIYYAVPKPQVQQEQELDPANWGILSSRFRIG